MSKGSKQRPGDKAKFDASHDRIFGPKKYKVTLHGCDDDTRVEVVLTANDYRAVERVALALNLVVEYNCMPRMSVVAVDA